MKIKPVPPLSVYMWALCLSCLAIIGLYIAFEKHLDSTKSEFLLEVDGKLSAVRDISIPGDRPFIVAGVGTSLIGAAIFSHNELCALTRTIQPDFELHYVSLARNAYSFTDWAEVMKRIISHSPDVILLEKTCLYFAPNQPYSFRMFCKEAFVQALQASMKMIRIGYTKQKIDDTDTHNQWKFRSVDHYTKIPTPPKQEFTDLKSVEIGFVHWQKMTDFGLRTEAESILQQCKALGIEVVILEIPHSASAESRLSANQNNKVERELQQFQKNGLAAVIKCPLIFNEDDFHDKRHMLYKARMRFSTWLIQMLKRRYSG